MAYGSLSGSYGMAGMTPGFDSVRSDSAANALGSIAGDRNKAESALAGNTLAARAQLLAQQYIADKQAESQREANSFGNKLLDFGGDVLGGFAGGFGGGLGKAAGAKWFA